MTAYYNEIDPYAAQWLRNLIAAGHIAPGEIDERSIVDVQPDDLKGFTQCHFFAGIGGWSLALRNAGWTDDRPVWSGSCPCQPFSGLGKQAGFDDPRHLWPQFRRLVEERRPSVLFGEQVARATDWLRLVRGDLEAMEYSVGAIPVEAASAGADHIRDRFWFVADTSSQRRQQIACCTPANEKANGRTGRVQFPQDSDNLTAGNGQSLCGDLLPGPGGKARRIKPGISWLDHGLPSRVAKLRAIGNAIDWRPAAEVITAYMRIAA